MMYQKRNLVRLSLETAADVKLANIADFNRQFGSLGEKPGTYST